MMKKTMALILSVLLICTLGGCASTSSTPTKPSELDLTPSADLSANLLDFQIQIDGVVYAIPCDVSDFLESGWESRDGLDFELEPWSYTANALAFTKGDWTVYSNLVNSTTTQTLPAEQCQLSGFTFSTSDAENGMAIVIPGGFSFGASADELIAAYGEPDEKNGDPVHLIEYEDPGEVYRGRWTFIFDTEGDGGLKEVRITREF